jgi:hypothetical protein
MSLNPLAPITDYQSMLNRIFWFTTASAIVAIWILRRFIQPLEIVLHEIDFTVEFGGDKILPVPGGYLFPALIVGILTRIYRAHACISDWLGIRECFDIEVIIGEFANQLAIDLTNVSEVKLVRCRRSIMRTAFYPFVSSPQPQIDPQLIHQALDAWSWFWIGIEATLVFVVTGLGLVAGGAFDVAVPMLCCTLVLAAIGLPAMRRHCQRYAIAQARAIVADPARAASVRMALAVLIDVQPKYRRAA